MIAGRTRSKGAGNEHERDKLLGIAGIAALAALLSACSAPEPKLGLASGDSKEYFAESEYGVKASPRVAFSDSGLQRGGGRYHVGKPYQIKGRWYHPKENPDYVTEGSASWYGSAFHGRLTANGEIYDMTHLTAAHPTMPLPSYARVTNLDNGSSVVVRVNDRGPFAKNRVIDVSKRAAEMLGYKHMGVARVRVEYVGPAPLHGQDDSYLLASYRPGGAAPDPSDGLPSGVMVAMNGPTPSQPVPSVAAAFASQPTAFPAAFDGSVDLPAVGPIVPDRPETGPGMPHEIALLSYADQRIGRAAQPFDAIIDPDLDAERLRSWWARKQSRVAEESGTLYINLGLWSSREQAESLARLLSAHGRVGIEKTEGEGATLYALSLLPDADPDRALRAAWAAGAAEAFTVRD